MSKVTTHPLKFPVELRNTEGEVIDKITELQLRRLNGKDMRAIANATAKGNGEVMAVLVCRCASIPPSTFDLLDAEDIAAVGEVAQGFIGGALPTGDQSSPTAPTS